MNLEEKGLAERGSSMTGGKLRTCLTQDPSAPEAGNAWTCEQEPTNSRGFFVSLFISD